MTLDNHTGQEPEAVYFREISGQHPGRGAPATSRRSCQAEITPWRFSMARCVSNWLRRVSSLWEYEKKTDFTRVPTGLGYYQILCAPSLLRHWPLFFLAGTVRL